MRRQLLHGVAAPIGGDAIRGDEPFPLLGDEPSPLRGGAMTADIIFGYE